MLKTVKQKMGLNISDLEAFSQIKHGIAVRDKF